MERIHVAVVGVGSFGRHHVRHLANHMSVESVFVVDKDPSRAAEVAALNGARAAADVAALNVDAVVITVPTEAHRDIAVPLLRKGVHCFVEKPVAHSDKAAQEMIAAAEAGGAVLQVGHIERFSPPFERLCAECGPVRHILARRHNAPRPVPPSVDVVLDLMIHDIDLSLTLAAAPVTHISAFAGDGDGQEAAHARIAFANGAVADLSASRLAPVPARTLEVSALSGMWHADLLARELHATIGRSPRKIAVESDRDSLGAELGEFVAAVAGGPKPQVGGQAGAKALSVANEIRAALQTTSLQLSA